VGYSQLSLQDYEEGRGVKLFFLASSREMRFEQTDRKIKIDVSACRGWNKKDSVRGVLGGSELWYEFDYCRQFVRYSRNRKRAIEGRCEKREGAKSVKGR
jgi:hypothetical protein